VSDYPPSNLKPRKKMAYYHMLATVSIVLDVFVTVILSIHGTDFLPAVEHEFHDKFCLGISSIDICVLSILRVIGLVVFFTYVGRLSERSMIQKRVSIARNVHVLSSASWVMVKGLTRLISNGDCGEIGQDTPANAWYWALMTWQILIPVLQGSLLLKITKDLPHKAKKYDPLNERLLSEAEETEEKEDVEAGTNSTTKKVYKAGFKDLFMLVAPDAWMILVAFIALLLAALGQVLIPHFTGEIVDSLVAEHKKSSVFQRKLMLLIASAGGCAFFTGVRGGLFTVVGARVNVRIRDMLFKSLVQQEIGFFDTTKTGDITSRLSSDTTMVGSQVSLNVNVFLRSMVQAFGTLVFMFYLSWKLSMVAFISVPVIVIISKFYGNYLRKLAKASQDALADANTTAEETISSMMTVRSFACEEAEANQYRSKLDHYYSLGIKEGWVYSFYAMTTVFLPQMVTALVLFYGGKLVLDGEISSGKLVSFLLYLQTLSDGFNMMGSIFSNMTQAVGAADKVFELIYRAPKVKKPILTKAAPTSSNTNQIMPVGLQRNDCKGKIELRNIVFRYPARPTRVVLKGLSFKVEAGQTLALVGPSGGGKSSAISLIEHFYDVDEGHVLLDDVSVTEYDPKWFHRQVSIVGQEPTLYARSIRRNIIFGLEGEEDEPTEAQIREAALLANAHDFITALPDGYDTEVGERGVQLSGGQKQRIAIARALVRKPKVLLLDEATSALDAESEHMVQEAIDRMIDMGGMTVIIIAHRLSTVKHADCIAVVQEGKIVETGAHEALIEYNGIYATLVKRQLQQTENVGDRSSEH